MSRKKTRYRSTKRKRTNNVLVFKLIDPICQSLLFIFFIYSLDAEIEASYRKVLLMLLGLQIVSLVINFFIKEENQLKNERIIFLSALALYFISFFIIQHSVSEKFIEVFAGGGQMKMPLIEIIMMSIAIAVAFWYFTICFREIRGLLKSDNSDD